MNLLKKWNSISNATKSTLAFTFSSFLIKGISLITTPIFTRMLSVEDYGLVSTYNSWLTILEVFCLLGLTSAGIFNVGLNDYKDNRDQFISSTLTLCNTITIAIFGLIGIGKIMWGNDFLLPNVLLVLMFVHFITNPAQIFWITRQRYELRYKAATLITILSSVFSQVTSIMCIKYADTINLGVVRLWSTEIVSLLFVIPIYFLLMIRGKKFVNFSIWKRLLIFAIPLIPHYLAQHIMTSADRIMLTNMVSQADTGIYSVVLNVGMVATIIWNAINASLIPHTFENLNERKYKDINHIVLILISGYAMMCVGVSLIAPEILKILAPEEYYAGVNAIPAIAGTAFLSALYNIYANIEFYYKKTFFIALSTIIASLSNILLNILLIPRLSYVGAAYTTLISYIILVFCHYVSYHRCRCIVYNSKIILFISVLCIVFCELSHLLYNFIWVRYGLIIALLIVVVLKRKTISTFITTMKRRT